MSEFRTEIRQIERRTYVKGTFHGTFLGTLDFANSSMRYEKFYDLEFLDAEICVPLRNFRPWTKGGEFEEFRNLQVFPTPMADDLKCIVKLDDGSEKHFNVRLFDVKLRRYTLTKQNYDGNSLFVTIDGEIGGYLRHEDQEEVLVPIEDPAKAKVRSDDTVTPRIELLDYNKDRTDSYADNRGCIAGIPEVSVTGCSFAFAAFFGVLMLFGFLAVFLHLGLAIISIPLFTFFAPSNILSLTILLILFLFFVYLQRKLAGSWSWLIGAIMILIFLTLIWK